MSDLNHPAYYQRREQQERALATRAFSPAIGDIHRELADRYCVLAQQAETAPVRPRLGLAYAGRSPVPA